MSIGQICADSKSWKAFLNTAAHTYKYSFPVQLAIHEQRPDATACASMKFWNDKMNRWIRKGSKAISITDDSGHKTSLFDIKDTVEGKNSLDIHQVAWSLGDKGADVAKALGYDSFESVIGKLVAQVTELYDTESKKLLSSSVEYIVLKRCGYEPDIEVNISDLDKEQLSSLGAQINEASKNILTQVEQIVKGGFQYGLQGFEEYEVQRDRRDTVSGYTGTGAEQIRSDAPEVLNGRTSADVHSTVYRKQAEQPSGGDRPAGAENEGSTDRRNADKRPGSRQEDRSDGVGAAHELTPTGSGRDRDERVSLQKDFLTQEPANYSITNELLGQGGAKTKYARNVEAIRTLQKIESESRLATHDEQTLLSQYVGWGGLPQVFDAENKNWQKEYSELKALLPESEYSQARASTLNAHYTAPAVIDSIYDVISRMNFEKGNILEPACGVGNFFGRLPESMKDSKLYGVELDSITGRIAKYLYPNAQITISGYEKTAFPSGYFDVAIGNVPFGSYKVSDEKHSALIHDYFFMKTLDQVRPGGVIAFITSKGTLDKENSDVRRYIAQQAELLGAVRLPNNAFAANAGTEVTTDILFLQKREPIEIRPDWLAIGETADGVPVNNYYVKNPHMLLGTMVKSKGMYGNENDTVCIPHEGVELKEALFKAVSSIKGKIPERTQEAAIEERIPADPNVRNYSYTLVNNEIYYRENEFMSRSDISADKAERLRGLIEIRDCTRHLINYQLEDTVDIRVQAAQRELNEYYDSFTERFGLLNDRKNAQVFREDSSYYLLCSLEVLDENGKLERKADMFSKRTIKQHVAIDKADTPVEALSISMSEKACVDIPYMTRLTGKDESAIIKELQGIIYFNPEKKAYETADEYLTGNVRHKLELVTELAKTSPELMENVLALEKVQPKALEAHEIDVRLGATWIDKKYIQQFIHETLSTAEYNQRNIQVSFENYTNSWNISGKKLDSGTISTETYGTKRMNAYEIIEKTLNMGIIRINDQIQDEHGNSVTVFNAKETLLAQQKQSMLKEAFKNWVFNEPERRNYLVDKYNRLYNSNRVRKYDGSNLNLSGINPEIKLREHQQNAIARIIHGGNTLLGHVVGAGKTFEMAAAAMEMKRLGLSYKSMFVVPNHLTEQTATEFLTLYPSTNVLVATKADFEAANRKKFCTKIATGDYDAVIIGHSQFTKIPVSSEYRAEFIQSQISDITQGIEQLKREDNNQRTGVKNLERIKKGMEERLLKLTTEKNKDDVITFEELGIDRLFVDEAHMYKNLYFMTKMHNVAGIPQTDAQKSSDLYMKCRYMDELTGGKGVIFATGTPVSNSMSEIYTMQRYLQYGALQERGLEHFDAWASIFGEITNDIELTPEGTGYRTRTRFAKFHNLPELMSMFRDIADIKLAEDLNLPVPSSTITVEVAKPTAHQELLVKELSERAKKVQTGQVKPNEDNMLVITTDGRKTGLDQRLIDPSLPDDPASKTNMCCKNILDIWKNTKAKKLTQLVFCDFSTPANKGFNVYDDIKNKLINSGVPEKEIAFIHDANTDQQKKELFAKVRKGQVRILFGSTPKMGAGTNVQSRLIATHDLDCPWRPADLEQRAGRIVRQGNENQNVHIFRYVTEKTFDAYLYQTLETKQKFISQIMRNKSDVRSCDDIDNATLSYAEIKALCAGNPLIKEKLNIDIEVNKLQTLHSGYKSTQYRLQDQVMKYLPEKIKTCEERISGFKQDMELFAKNQYKGDGTKSIAPMKIHGVVYTNKEAAGTVLLECFGKALNSEKPHNAVHIGSYQGFEMSMRLGVFGQKELLFTGALTHTVELGDDLHGNFIRIYNAFKALQQELKKAENQLNSLNADLINAKEEIKKPFAQEGELTEKIARQTELAMLLNKELDMEENVTPLQNSKTIGDLNNPKRILICEDIATGAILHESTHQPVICATNNIKDLAVAIREKYGNELEIIIAGNVDKQSIEEVAKSCNATAVTPRFTQQQIDKGYTSFSDLAMDSKLAVRKQVYEAMDKEHAKFVSKEYEVSIG